MDTGDPFCTKADLYNAEYMIKPVNGYENLYNF